LEEEGEDMAKTGRFLHSVVNGEDIAGVGTSYDVTKYHLFDLNVIQSIGTLNPFKGFLRSMIIRATSITGGASKVTFRICCDANGDYTVLGDTEVAFDLGLTTATTGCAQVLFDDYPFWEALTQSDNVYVFYKVDAGSVTIDLAQINWSE